MKTKGKDGKTAALPAKGNGRDRGLGRDLGEATHCIAAARDLCVWGICSPEQAEICFEGIQALLEKAGYLADKSLKSLGEIPVMGSYDRWREAAQETQEKAPV